MKLKMAENRCVPVQRVRPSEDPVSCSRWRGDSQANSRLKLVKWDSLQMILLVASPTVTTRTLMSRAILKLRANNIFEQSKFFLPFFISIFYLMKKKCAGAGDLYIYG